MHTAKCAAAKRQARRNVIKLNNLCFAQVTTQSRLCKTSLKLSLITVIISTNTSNGQFYFKCSLESRNAMNFKITVFLCKTNSQSFDLHRQLNTKTKLFLLNLMF